MADSSDLLTLAQEVIEVSRLAEDDDVDAVLARYVDRLVRTVPRCDHASVTIVTERGLETVAGTALPELVDLPETAAAPGGPVFEAITFQEPRRIPDVENEERWPEYTKRMVKTGMRSALVLPLPSMTTPASAMTLFSRTADQFVDTSYDVVLLFVLHAGVVFDNATLYEDSRRLVDQLRAALRTRSTIGQAQGLLMHRGRYPTDQAFILLRTASQRGNIKLRDLAAELVTAQETNRLDAALTRFGLLTPSG